MFTNGRQLAGASGQFAVTITGDGLTVCVNSGNATPLKNSFHVICEPGAIAISPNFTFWVFLLLSCTLTVRLPTVPVIVSPDEIPDLLYTIRCGRARPSDFR